MKAKETQRQLVQMKLSKMYNQVVKPLIEKGKQDEESLSSLQQ